MSFPIFKNPVSQKKLMFSDLHERTKDWEKKSKSITPLLSSTSGGFCAVKSNFTKGQIGLPRERLEFIQFLKN